MVFDKPLDSTQGLVFGSGALDWEPIGLNYFFGGTFDGCGHTVWGLVNGMIYDNSYGEIEGSVGLFGVLREGTVSNVTVACSWLGPIAENVGVIVGKSDAGIISNCHAVESLIHASALRIGGICGNISGWDSGGEIVDSSSCGLILGRLQDKYIQIGGIVGNGTSYDKSGMVYNCYNSCKLGIVAEFSQDYSNGFDLPYIDIGGIAGKGAIISNCHNAGEIAVTAHNKLSGESSDAPRVQIGGITGSCIASVTNSSNCGNLAYHGDVEDVYMGGIAGLLGPWRPFGDFLDLYKVDISYCYSNAKVDTDLLENIGGVVGSACGEIAITNSYYNKNYSNKALAMSLPRMKEFGYDYSIKSKIFTDQIKGLSDEELKNYENYYNWDFNSIWDIDNDLNNGLPTLRALASQYEVKN